MNNPCDPHQMVWPETPLLDEIESDWPMTSRPRNVALASVTIAMGILFECTALVLSYTAGAENVSDEVISFGASVLIVGGTILVFLELGGFRTSTGIALAGGLLLLFSKSLDVTGNLDSLCPVPLLGRDSPANGIVENATFIAALFALQAALVALALEARGARRRLAQRHLALLQETATRRQTEQVLRESEERYRLIVEHVGADIAIVDADGMFHYMNSAAVATHGGRNMSEFAGKTMWDLFPPEYADRQMANVRQTLRTMEKFQEECLAVADGHKRWYDVTFLPILESRHEKPRALIIARDITSRRDAEKDHVRLTTAIEQATESVMITDPAGRIQYVNPAFEQLTGYAREEVIGQTPRMLHGGRHSEAFYRNLWRTLASGRVWHGRFINRKKSGELFEEEATLSAVRTEAGEIINYVAIKRDVTAEVNLEKRLRQSQKMEAIGILAGHIAHDFKNILALILGHCEMALERLPDEHPVRFHVQHVVKAGHRAVHIVKEILTFSRQLEQERKPVRLGETVREAIEALRVSLPAQVNLRQEFDETAGIVLADPDQIHQVVSNLCDNALHAMNEQGGVLTVAVDRLDVTADAVADAGTLGKGPYVRLTVGDTGHGMDTATLARVFEPFFTTKKAGEGTGLGLSTVHGIVTSCDGAILVHSSPGQGASFQLYFPQIDVEVEPAPAETLDPLPGRERVLLVDDDAELAEVMATGLRQHGYVVETRFSASSALDAFTQSGDDYDIVVTDQIMPDMTGLELARELLRARPDLPILLITGFAYGTSAEQAKAEGIRDCLHKPVSTAPLTHALRRALAPVPGVAGQPGM